MTCRYASAVLATVVSAALPPAAALAQGTPRAQSQGASSAARSGQQPATPSTRRAGTAPQGFSVVLVLGDIQGATPTEEVPAAARKALTDMRDFLPFKSYRLLDAAWLMCCGSMQGGVRSGVSQILRGPEDQEYELKLTTDRAENSRIFVRFSLFSPESGSEAETAPVAATAEITSQLADLQDRRNLLEMQVKEARKRVEVGTMPAIEVSKLEMELRSLQRRIDDLTAARQRAAQRRPYASTTQRASRHPVMDTTFTMDVGETVVVGTSRLRGGTKALIALLTAVPPRTGAGKD
jgi:hypothetical protein